MPKPCESEFKERALRMLAEALPEHASVHAASIFFAKELDQPRTK